MTGKVAACIAAILSIGGSGMIAQTTLLRELLSQFAGSELYIGLIIGNWIAAEALGAFAAGRYKPDSTRIFSRFISLTLIFSLLFPVMLFLSRTWRAAVSLPPHEAVSVWQILSISIIIVFPLAVIHGGQFVLATSLYARITGSDADSPGKVYGVETVGTVIGGGVASFLLIPLVTPFQTAALLLLANGVICIFLRRLTPGKWQPSGWVALLTPILAAAILSLGGAEFLDSASLRLQWRGDTLVAARNTPYQNIAVIRDGEQFTFYTDGTPLVSLPDPDTARIEESAHLPLLAHPHPRRVLVLGGGAGGVLSEILKHPSVERIDYLELDPVLVQTIEKYAPPATLQELHDPRVSIHYRDGRAFLRDAAGRYDVILIGMPLPLNLQGNRYFTAEFFTAVKGALEPAGVVAIGASGSMSYYGEALQEVTGSLVTTLRATFPHILVVPGERNLFMASAELPLEKLVPEDFSWRLESRAVQTALLSPPHLQWLLSSTPRQWFESSIGTSGAINSDFSPCLLTRHLLYRTMQLNPEIKPALEIIGGVRTFHLAIVLLCATVVVAVLARKKSGPAVIWTMATTGFAAMLLELSFFYIFQLFQGVMLQTIGLLIAIFMAGLWSGSRVSSPLPVAVGQDMRRLFAGEIILVLLAALLWLISAGVIISVSSSTLLLYLTLLPLIFLAGCAAGLQFPPATRLMAGASGPGTSLVYGFDLLGGWLGGVVGGALILPLLGFSATAVLLVLLKGGSILCLYLQGKLAKI